MKHIKRKFFHEISGLPDSVPKTFIEKGTLEEEKQKLKDSHLFLVTDDNKTILAFPYDLNGKIYGIPEPHPVVIYFNIAQDSNRELLELKKKLIESVNYDMNKNAQTVMHNLYALISATSSYAIFLFMSLETMLNVSIPANAVIRKPQKRKIEVFTNEHLQTFDFFPKLKEVLATITGKDYVKLNKEEFKHIVNLKAFRDEIVHTKRKTGDQTPFSKIYQTALNFDYESTLVAAKNLINFYQNGLIEPCPCGKDF